MQPVTEVGIEPGRAHIHEHGWQSWSPTTSYRVDERPHRPVSDRNRILCYRPEMVVPAEVYQGEGLLVVDPGDGGAVTVFAAPDGRIAVPSIRAQVDGGRVLVSSDGEVEVTTDDGPGGIPGALARWADRTVATMGLPAVRPAPTTWCSWYHYYTEVTEADIDENLVAMDELALPVDVVQLDDGYQTALGDWLSLSDRFASLPGMVDRVRARGRQAGVWVAPFLVGERSELYRDHPDWLVMGDDGPVHAGHNWDQNLAALDTTHPGAQAYLQEVFGTFRDWGFDLFKLDFLFAAALPGRRYSDATPLAAYRHGLEVIRGAIDDAYLLGCGAPMLPSLGLVDAMRVSPDTDPRYEPADGDLSQPSSRAAMLTGEARAFMHGRFWANDPDCLIARPEVEQREAWAAYLGRRGGLRSSSDRLRALDDWGRTTTHRFLSEPVPDLFVPTT